MSSAASVLLLLRWRWRGGRELESMEAGAAAAPTTINHPSRLLVPFWVLLRRLGLKRKIALLSLVGGAPPLFV